MSGGHFNYCDRNLKAEMFGFGEHASNVLEDRELSELTFDLLELIKTFDYYKSDDTGKETYLKHKEQFKKKWFSNRGFNIRRIVDEALAQTKSELYETFNLKED